MQMTDEERICFDRSMDQWRRSLGRLDLSEEDRVKGALLAYQRQAFAFEMLRHKEVESQISQLRHAYTHLINGTVGDMKEFARGLIGPAIERLERSRG